MGERINNNIGIKIIVVASLLLSTIIVSTMVVIITKSRKNDTLLYPDFDESLNIQFAKFKNPYETNKKGITWSRDGQPPNYTEIGDADDLNCTFYMNFASIELLKPSDNNDTALRYEHRIIVSDENNRTHRRFDATHNFIVNNNPKYRNNDYYLCSTWKQSDPVSITLINITKAWSNSVSNDIIMGYQIYRDSENTNLTLVMFMRLMRALSGDWESSSMISSFCFESKIELPRNGDWYITESSVAITRHDDEGDNNDSNCMFFRAYQAFNGNLTPTMRFDKREPYNSNVWYFNNRISYRLGETLYTTKLTSLGVGGVSKYVLKKAGELKFKKWNYGVSFT
jgi:hypothetical protein